MGQPTGDDTSNVVPLRRSRPAHRPQANVLVPDLQEAIQSFDQLERHTAMLQSGPLGVAGEAGWPIVSYQVQLPVVQRQLDELERVTIVVWPDTHWVLRLNSARLAAMARLRAVTRSLHRNPPGTGPLDGGLAEDIRELSRTLRGLRQLLVQQCQEALGAP